MYVCIIKNSRPGVEKIVEIQLFYFLLTIKIISSSSAGRIKNLKNAYGPRAVGCPDPVCSPLF